MRKLGCLATLLVILGGATLGWLSHDWLGAGPAVKPVAVIVPEGASLARAATELQQAGAIRSAVRFRGFARLFGNGQAIMPYRRMPARPTCWRCCRRARSASG